MEDLAESKHFGDLIRNFHDSGKPVAAVCHGPAALLPARTKVVPGYSPATG
ncbi:MULTISPECIES: DJ-1/PfpI family protein [unclassified Rhodococcus (in: high G+C Gram-positive bacteria)]|uniref:DJ-1/PfpI family protein n=1 Tax=unclassified Rhodococcus (in: high G+C Gram-positive bacteria) TaxID=192944 RepID=UPI0027B8962F|nr:MULTISPECIES: DJ-1/PfpI family protein [unclassified Rhodococcus (in: high G+C Gram-positive bacteria)]